MRTSARNNTCMKELLFQWLVLFIEIVAAAAAASDIYHLTDEKL